VTTGRDLRDVDGCVVPEFIVFISPRYLIRDRDERPEGLRSQETVEVPSVPASWQMGMMDNACFRT